jgi:hypothetical protein
MHAAGMAGLCEQLFKLQRQLHDEALRNDTETVIFYAVLSYPTRRTCEAERDAKDACRACRLPLSESMRLITSERSSTMYHIHVMTLEWTCSPSLS